MHIAFFSDQHPATLGGLQVAVGVQRSLLERAGHRVTVCAPASARVPSEEYARASDVLLPARQIGEHSFFLPGAGSDRAIESAFDHLPPVDVVHIHADLWGAWSGYRFARARGLPVVHTWHTNIEAGVRAAMPLPGLALRAMFAAQRRFLGVAVESAAGYLTAFADRADAVVVPSVAFAEALRGAGVMACTVVIPTGVDDRLIDGVAAPLAAASDAALASNPARCLEPRLEPRPELRSVREPALSSSGEPVLVWAGRISPEKRLPDLIAAFAASQVPAVLRVFGDGAERDRCERLAARLGIAARVRFEGVASHAAVLRAIRAADAVVQSSLGYETQGLTVTESVGLGTPVLLRDRDVARELPDGCCVRAADESLAALTGAVRILCARLANGRIAVDEVTRRRQRQSSQTRATVALYERVIGGRIRQRRAVRPGADAEARASRVR